MATIAESVRRLTIESTTRGVTQTTDQLKQLGQAQAGVTVESQRSERATQSLDTRLTSLRRRFDEQFRATQDLARVERDLNAIRAQGLINAGEQSRLMALATTRISGLRPALAAGAQSSRNFGFAIQNAGFQVGDFAVQVASGQGFIRPFIQQGTQLLQIFGPIGSVIGAAGAVVGALAVAFLNLGEEADEAADKNNGFLKSLNEAKTAAERYKVAVEAANAVLLTSNEQAKVAAETKVNETRRTLEASAAIERETIARTRLLQQERAALVERHRQIQNPDVIGDRMGGFFRPQSVADFEETIRRAEARLRAVNQLLNAVNDPTQLGSAREAAEKAAEEAAREAERAAERSAKEIERLNAAFNKASEQNAVAAQKLVDRLDPAAAATRKFQEEQALLLVAMANGIEITGGYEAALQRLEQSYRDQIDPIGAFIRKNEEQVKSLALQLQLVGKSAEEAAVAMAKQQFLAANPGATADQASRFEESASAIARMNAELERQKAIADLLPNAFEQAFDRIGSGITEAMATGQIEFAKLGDIGRAVLSELIQLAIQLSVINPLKNALFDSNLPVIGDVISNLFGGSGAGATSPGMGRMGGRFEMGAAFSRGNVIPFARGGIVNAPTIFPMARGAGLMGEAGPEAVLPLERTTDGRLGVISQGGGGDVDVIINNFSGQQASVEQRQGANGKRQLIVSIGQAVADDIRTGGPASRAMESTFALRRSGSGRG